MINDGVPNRNQAIATLITALLLAAIHQYLFFENSVGVSYPIFVVLFYAYMLYYSKDILRKPTWVSYVGLAAILLLSFSYVLFTNPVFSTLNSLAIPILIVLHMSFMLNSRNLSWTSPALIVNALDQLLPQNLRHWGTVFGWIRQMGGPRLKEGQKHAAGKILIGLLVSCPLLLVVTSLLSSADGVFNQLLSEIPKVLNGISLGEGFVRTLWTFIFGLGLFGYLWGFVKPHQPEELPRKEGWEPLEPLPTFKIDPIIAATILFAINSVYVLFVIVQFSYLFGSWEGLLPEGSSYAEYARRGFFELIIVTSLNFVILMSTLVLGGKVSGMLQKIINILLHVMVVCSMVMLYSAYTRLNLYEEAYGYTYIRFLVHAFMIFLAILLIIAGLRILFQGLPMAKCYIILGLASYVIMNYVNMDVMIADRNIDRFKTSGNIDAEYLATLSTDATPTLIEFSRQENGMLDAHLRDRLRDAAKGKRNWPSFNLSEHRARHALQKYFADHKD